jgi:hypothetical protein
MVEVDYLTYEIKIKEIINVTKSNYSNIAWS